MQSYHFSEPSSFPSLALRNPTTPFMISHPQCPMAISYNSHTLYPNSLHWPKYWSCCLLTFLYTQLDWENSSQCAHWLVDWPCLYNLASNSSNLNNHSKIITLWLQVWSEHHQLDQTWPRKVIRARVAFPTPSTTTTKSMRMLNCRRYRLTHISNPFLSLKP